jgi:hypothetical protein
LHSSESESNKSVYGSLIWLPLRASELRWLTMLTTGKDSHHGPVSGTFVTGRSLAWLLVDMAELSRTRE